jgi:hypothetical protein
VNPRPFALTPRWFGLLLLLVSPLGPAAPGALAADGPPNATAPIVLEHGTITFSGFEREWASPPTASSALP